MKTFDEIVFEKRNKEYGSYILRKRYGKNLMISIIISLFVFIVTIGSAFITIDKTYKSKDSDKNINVEILAPPPVDAPVLPPPPLADLNIPKFVAPTVVDDENIETNIGTQDDLNAMPISPTISDNMDVVVTETEKPPVIEQPKPTEIFTIVEEQPSFNGDIYKFLQGAIRYPEEARELNIQGRVFVTFVVEKDGSITDIKILRGIGGGCDEEAIRLIKSMPNWTPGKQRGNAVRVQFNLPIKFTLQE